MKQVELDTHVMRETVQQLEDSSKDIHAIVGIVHSIADQTNLLVLNSAIALNKSADLLEDLNINSFTFYII